MQVVVSDVIFVVYNALVSWVVDWMDIWGQPASLSAT